MDYDKAVPKNLKAAQEWFGSIIGRPIDIDSRMTMVSPSGNPMEEEAALFIAPSPTLKPHQRIQLYNQQYWWRLLNTLQEAMPFVLRMFGYADFNVKIAFPYLVKYPPNHWSLNLLADRIVQWSEEDYDAPDKELVRRAIAVDAGYNVCFLAPNREPMKMAEGGMEAILEARLVLPEYMRLFRFPYHLFDFREEFLKHDPDYWVEHDFPELKKGKTYHFALYRTPKNLIDWKEIEPGEYFLLSLFQKGCTIDEACEALDGQPQEFVQACEQKLQAWFQEWVIRRWLVVDD